MEKRPITFAIVWNGTIEGRATNYKNQYTVLNSLFQCNYGAPDVNRYIKGKIVFPKGAAIKYTRTWEEDPVSVMEDLRKLGICQPDKVASAFHAYLIEHCAFGTLFQAEIDKAMASGDPLYYIGAVLYCALYNRCHRVGSNEPLSDEEREHLKTLDTATVFKNIFGSQSINTFAEEIKSARERIQKTSEEISTARNNERFADISTRKVLDAIDNLLDELDNLLCELK